MTGPPLFASFYTAAYAGEAAGLVETLGWFNLPHAVRPVPSLGTWERNCGAKPAYLRAIRAEFPGRPIIWLDADARVVRAPSLLTEPLAYDFAAHWFRGEELISACLYFDANPVADALLGDWEAGCAAHPNEWDQRILARCVERANALRVLRLPPEYNWIDAGTDSPDLSEQTYGRLAPVIVQRQASRRLKRVEQLA